MDFEKNNAFQNNFNNLLIIFLQLKLKIKNKLLYRLLESSETGIGR